MDRTEQINMQIYYGQNRIDRYVDIYGQNEQKTYIDRIEQINMQIYDGKDRIDRQIDGLMRWPV